MLIEHIKEEHAIASSQLKRMLDNMEQLFGDKAREAEYLKYPQIIYLRTYVLLLEHVAEQSGISLKG